MPKVGTRPGPKPPTQGTLRNYGLTADEWRGLVERCGGVCFVCGQPFGDRPLVIDHEHVRGWRARKPKLRSGKRRAAKDARVMTPAERKRYVRGVLHSYCNRFVRRWLTLERGRAIVAYLEDYARRSQS